MQIDPLIKRQICDFVRDNENTTTKEVQEFTEKVLNRRLTQSTISTIIRKNNLQIQRQGGKGRKVKTHSLESHPDPIHSTIANIPFSHLKTLAPGKVRHRPSGLEALEVRMLEEIYRVINVGELLISFALLQDLLRNLCESGAYPIPAVTSKFLRDLGKKYFLANQVARFLNKKVDYADMIESLKGVFPAFEFATRNPGVFETTQSSSNNVIESLPSSVEVINNTHTTMFPAEVNVGSFGIDLNFDASNIINLEETTTSVTTTNNYFMESVPREGPRLNETFLDNMEPIDLMTGGPPLLTFFDDSSSLDYDLLKAFDSTGVVGPAGDLYHDEIWSIFSDFPATVQ